MRQDSACRPIKLLFYKLFSTKAFLLFAVISLSLSFATPAHAFDLSFITDIFSFTKATANDESREENSQNTFILSASPSPVSTPSEGDGEVLITEDASILPDAGPMGSIVDVDELAKTNGRISAYIVRKGDTIQKIAKMFGVSTNTILWANDLKSAQTLREGDTLVILPISGVQHIVVKGDTISGIAKKYGGNVSDILKYNNIDSKTKLALGDVIMVPDGVVKAISGSTPTSAPRGYSGLPDYAGYYLRPITNGRKTQGIHGYNGVDFAPYCHCSGEEPILASAPGQITIAKGSGWNGGYGRYVVISHPNGTQTLYAHMAYVLVNPGGNVARGQIIGYVGNTGRSTGPHVHFEIRGARNPF